MSEKKSFLHFLVEAIDLYRAQRPAAVQEPPPTGRRSWLRWLGHQMIPNVGTLLLVAVLLLTVPSLAAPRYALEATSTSTISYQGRLADSGGNPLTGYYNLEFRIYDVPDAGVPLWEEFWTGGNSVQVSDGLFNVMLGSIDNTLASSIEGYDELYLGITVGTDSEMVPRVQLGSVPFSMQAMTVPDGSIGMAKIATGAITTTHILDGAVTQVKLGDNVELVPPYEGFSYRASYTKPAGWNPIIADTLDFNTFGTGSYDTSTGTFTAPKAGYYRLASYGYIATAGITTDDVRLGMPRNGGTTAVSTGPSLSHVMYLNVGDTVKPTSYTPTDCTFGGTYPWWFQGEYLGE